MTQRGDVFADGPQACPFIALELDRDRRSDKPDSRHRCFAEPTPQPRAIAHQEQFCLSPGFAACPIFQGWAMRAAARPVPMQQGATPQPPAASLAHASGQSTLPLDLPPVVPPPGEAWPADAFAQEPAADAPQQIAAFEAASATVPGDAAIAEEPPSEPAIERESTNRSEPVTETSDDPPVPGFLAGRTERPTASRPRSSRADEPEVPYRETISREDVIPSWDLTDRYGADGAPPPNRSSRGGRDRDADDGDRFGGLVVMIAVLAILSLGVLGVILLPGMLAGHASTPTPPASALPTGFATPSLPVLATDTPLVTPLPTGAVTPAPTPEATPRLYKIKSTDNSLTAIARRFGLTLRQLLDANPQITDPNHIQVGQVITIPEPPPTPAPS